MSSEEQTAPTPLTEEEYDDLWVYVADQIHTALYNARLDILKALLEPLNDADRMALAPITDDLSALEEKYLYPNETRLGRVKRAVAVLMGEGVACHSGKEYCLLCWRLVLWCSWCSALFCEWASIM